MKSFLELSKERYSVRGFTNQPVEKEKIDAIIEAGQVAPTAVNNQPVKIWVIESEEAKKVIDNAHPFNWAKDAPVTLVVGANKDQAWVRQQDDYNFADIDASIVATHMMLEIVDQGLGSTWCGHFDPKILKEAFPQMKDYNLVAMFPIGYIASDIKPNPRHTQYKTKEEMVETL